jgi:hypothetical protein
VRHGAPQLTTNDATQQRVAAIIKDLLNSETARRCRKEVIEKKTNERIMLVAREHALFVAAVGAFNLVTALIKIQVGLNATLKATAPPSESAPAELIEDLTHNVSIMWAAFTADDATGARSPGCQLKAFVQACLTLYCNGFIDRTRGIKIKRSVTLNRFLVQSPMVTRVFSVTSSLVGLLTRIKDYLCLYHTTIHLRVLKDTYDAS